MRTQAPVEHPVTAARLILQTVYLTQPFHATPDRGRPIAAAHRMCASCGLHQMRLRHMPGRHAQECWLRQASVESAWRHTPVAHHQSPFHHDTGRTFGPGHDTTAPEIAFRRIVTSESQQGRNRRFCSASPPRSEFSCTSWLGSTSSRSMRRSGSN